jgi:hypothetical protein
MARFFVLTIDKLQDDEMCFRKFAENLEVLGSPRLLAYFPTTGTFTRRETISLIVDYLYLSHG